MSWNSTRAVALLATVLISPWLQSDAMIMFVVGAAAVATISPVVRLLWRRYRLGQARVLWIRKFARGSTSRRLQYLFQMIVAPWGQLITLTDHDVRGPHVSYVLIGAVLLVVFVVGTIQQPAMSPADAVQWLVGGIVIMSILGACAVAVISRRSITRVRNAADLPRVDALARRIRAERFVSPGLGAQSIRCSVADDQLWRSVIERLAPAVDVVIVDLGDSVSANLEWEIDTLLSVRGAARLVVTGPQGGTGTTFTFHRRHAAEPAAPVVFEVVPYPQVFPRLNISRRQSARLADLIRPLQRAVGIRHLRERPGIAGESGALR